MANPFDLLTHLLGPQNQPQGGGPFDYLHQGGGPMDLPGLVRSRAARDQGGAAEGMDPAGDGSSGPSIGTALGNILAGNHPNTPAGATGNPGASGPSPTPGAAPQQGDEQVVEGDPWKPHKRTFLGFLADVVAHHADGSTPFADKSDQDNYASAMQGFQKNPERAINRMTQIDPKTAWSMSNTNIDNKRGDKNADRLGRVYDNANFDKTRMGIAGMLSASNEKTFGPMLDMAKKRAEKNGIPFEDFGFPSNYDPETFQAIARGEIPPAKREALAQGDARIAETVDHHMTTEDQTNTGLGIRRDAVDNTAGYRKARLGQIGAHNAATEGQGQDKIYQAQQRLEAKTPRMVNTPQGMGELSPDHRFMRVKRQDGTFGVFKNAGGDSGKTNWTKVN